MPNAPHESTALKHKEAAALKTRAELYAPGSYFMKVVDDPKVELYTAAGSALQAHGLSMTGCTIQGSRIGIWVHKDGSVAVACS
jgi:hypothetical protein